MCEGLSKAKPPTTPANSITPPRMRDDGGTNMGLMRSLLVTLFALLAVVAGIGFVLYLADYKVEANVQETHCQHGEVHVKTKQFGIEHTVKDIPMHECVLLKPGSFVEYRIRTQRTTLYVSEGGDCVYDSATGPC